MKLYDETIREALKFIDESKARVITPASGWEDVGQSEIILKSDMAYELGAGSMPAVGATAITEDISLCEKDEVYLIGEDLSEIKADRAYAKLAIVRVKEDSLGESDALYTAIRNIEYVRYRVNPKGYMTRVSATNSREPVRIGKDALKDGLDFSKVAGSYLEAYHLNPKVEAVKLIFITDEAFNYVPFSKELNKLELITKTIDRAITQLNMDCHTCNLKEVCDEVEGLKELHFSQVNSEN